MNLNGSKPKNRGFRVYPARRTQGKYPHVQLWRWSAYSDSHTCAARWGEQDRERGERALAHRYWSGIDHILASRSKDAFWAAHALIGVWILDTSAADCARQPRSAGFPPPPPPGSRWGREHGEYSRSRGYMKGERYHCIRPSSIFRIPSYCVLSDNSTRSPGDAFLGHLKFPLGPNAAHSWRDWTILDFVDHICPHLPSLCQISRSIPGFILSSLDCDGDCPRAGT